MGVWNERRFIMKKKMMALLLTVSVICGMLSGCGGAPSSSASSEDGLPTYDLKMTAGITHGNLKMQMTASTMNTIAYIVPRVRMLICLKLG